MALKPKRCKHMPEAADLKKSSAYNCEKCLKTNDRWLHLRTCQTCGITLCCDSSPNKHATQHFKETGHPVVISAEPKEKWMWCYKDQLFTDY